MIAYIEGPRPLSEYGTYVVYPSRQPPRFIVPEGFTIDEEMHREFARPLGIVEIRRVF